MNCDPRVQHRFSVCPEGYCCVRDEFWPSWVYCRKMGLVHRDCTTRDTETNCPCGPGLLCKPNIRDSHSGVASLYGRCVNDSSQTTTTASTTTTPTSTITSTSTSTIVTTTPTPTVPVEPLQQSTPCAHGHSCEEHGPLTPAAQTHEPDEQRPKEDHAEGGPLVG